MAGSAVLNEMDGFELTSSDVEDQERQSPQLIGQFLIDTHGLVRWANVECAEGFEGLAKFPSNDEIMAAVEGGHLA